MDVSAKPCGHDRQRLFLPFGDIGVLVERYARVRHGHEEKIAFVQRRHELAADLRRDEHRARKYRCGGKQCKDPVVERLRERGTIDCPHHPHHRIGGLVVQLSLEQQRTEHRDERHRDDGGREDRDGLCEGERVEQLAFLSRQREHGNEGKDDDGH